MSKWHEYLLSKYFLSKATNPKWSLRKRCNVCSRAHQSSSLAAIQPTFLPNYLPTGVDIISSRSMYFGGGYIRWSLCIQNVQGLSLRTSEWTEGHWWRLDCNALRQSWSIRQRLFIFAICQQWLWSMRDNSSRAKTSHVCNIHLHGTRASWYGPTLRK